MTCAPCLLGITHSRATSEYNFAKRTLTPEDIIKIICVYHDVPFSNIMGRNRSAENVKARHRLLYFLHHKTGMTLKAIGQLIGGRDHTTVIHAKDNIQNLMAIYPDYRKEMLYIDHLLDKATWY